MGLSKVELSKIEQIVADFLGKKPNFTALAAKHGRSPATIGRYYKKFLNNVSFSEFRGVGQPSKIEKAQNSWIGQRISDATKRLSCAALAEAFSQKFGVKVSTETMRRRLQILGYRSLKPTKKPLITKIQKRKRVAFCIKNRKTKWDSVIFTDEASFQVGGWEGRQWCLKGTHPIVLKTKFPAKLMVWGGISMQGKTPLYFIDGTLKGEGYKKLLADHYIPWTESKNLSELLFQQDNAPCHTAKVVKAFMEDKKMEVLAWPANSPDLNPIENIWGILKGRVAKRSPATKEELKEVLLEEWDNITPELIRNCIKNMPERVMACRNAKGGHTRY